MRNKRMWLLMAMALGLVGCKNGNVENENAGNNANDIIKADTALVLHHVDAVYRTGSYNVLCGKDGTVYTDNAILDKSPLVGNSRTSLRDVANVGDTVIVAHDDGYSYIRRNLTMENKIKAFSRQK
ncbi:MAG: hypothetical protein K2L94_03265 [Alphaproteobacteria bacterium]|nr:hypothetical protein [Alphaproteobacteria bacterium]